MIAENGAVVHDLNGLAADSRKLFAGIFKIKKAAENIGSLFMLDIKLLICLYAFQSAA